jgi:hypothetical protein
LQPPKLKNALNPEESSVAGLFFCRRLRSHTRMDPDLENVIRQALAALAVEVGAPDLRL